MQALIDLGVFTGKAFIILFVVGALLMLIANLVFRLRHLKEELEIEDLSKKYKDYQDIIVAFTADSKAAKKELKKQHKEEEKKKDLDEKKPQIFVLDFEGDIKASQVDGLRDKITAVLTSARPDQDEAVVRLESPGGMVHTYGLAAAQLMRFKEHKIKLTVCVDKVAASGGYLMACTADQILAAPFAILGSIGVVAQVPNFHRLLKKHDVDYEEITAGEFKRTISLLGEITPKGRQKFLDQIEVTHELFKSFVSVHRPQLDVAQVATGEYWYGQEALRLKLTDLIMSSDEYLFQRRNTHRILRIDVPIKKTLGEKLSEAITLGLDRLLLRWWQRFHEQSLFTR